VATFITFAIVMGVVVGAVATYFLRVSLAIGREDRAATGSLRFAATTQSAQDARDLVGISSSRWD